MTPGQFRTLEAVAACHRDLYEGSPQYLIPRGGRVAVCRAMEAAGILVSCADVGEDPEKLATGYGLTDAGVALCRAQDIPLECPCVGWGAEWHSRGHAPECDYASLGDIRRGWAGLRGAELKRRVGR